MKAHKATKLHTFVMTGTKWEIFKAAVELFAKHGYASVGIRDIAHAAGMKSSNIYNYFKNKDAFLEQMFGLYREKFSASYPALEDILEQIPTTPPRKLLAKLYASFDGEEDLFSKIALIAMEERDRDLRAESLMLEVFVNSPRRYLSAILSRMMALEIIEPLDIDAFVSIVTGFNFFVAARAGGNHVMSFSEWKSAHELILTMVREKHHVV